MTSHNYLFSRLMSVEIHEFMHRTKFFILFASLITSEHPANVSKFYTTITLQY